MSEIEWTNEAAIELVEEYKKRPELWNKNHDLYRVQTAKYVAWADMAKMFECDITDLKKKLNSLMASHRREKARVRNGVRSNWFLYDHMRFLPMHVDNPDVTNSFTGQFQQTPPKHLIETTPAIESDNQEQTDCDDEDTSYEPEPIIVKQEAPKRKVIVTKNRNFKPLRRHVVSSVKEVSKNNLDSKLIEALKLLKKSDLSKKKDECDSFGEYIATSLRKHDEWTQSMIKQAINNILFEQEMKKYNCNNGQYTVVVGSVEENPLMDGDSIDAK